MRPFLFFGAMLGLGLIALRAEPRQFVSGTNRTALIELFTSEGCSSCPPAERWFGSLRSAPGLWHDFVPVAFHVDYWNRLGWPDRFSRRDFTQREYAYAAAWHSGSVYTPCFVRDGAEWREAHSLAPSDRPAGVLTATYDGATLRAVFAPANPADAAVAWQIHAALLGGGVASKVTGGENRGATLAHEFVALASAQAAAGASLALPRRSVAGVTRYALAVWVTRRGDLDPVQATGGWL